MSLRGGIKCIAYWLLFTALLYVAHISFTCIVRTTLPTWLFVYNLSVDIVALSVPMLAMQWLMVDDASTRRDFKNTFLLNALVQIFIIIGTISLIGVWKDEHIAEVQAKLTKLALDHNSMEYIVTRFQFQIAMLIVSFCFILYIMVNIYWFCVLQTYENRAPVAPHGRKSLPKDEDTDELEETITMRNSAKEARRSFRPQRKEKYELDEE